MPVPKSGKAVAEERLYIEGITNLVCGDGIAIPKPAVQGVVERMLNLNAFVPLNSKQIYDEMMNPDSRTGARIKATIQKRAVGREVLAQRLSAMLAKHYARKRAAILRKHLREEDYYYEKRIAAYVESQEAIRESMEEIAELRESWRQFNQIIEEANKHLDEGAGAYYDDFNDYMEAELDFSSIQETVDVLENKVEHRKTRFYDELKAFEEIIQSQDAQKHLNADEQHKYAEVSRDYSEVLGKLEKLMNRAAEGVDVSEEQIQKRMAKLRTCYEARRELMVSHVERLRQEAEQERDPQRKTELNVHANLIEGNIIKKDDKFNFTETRVQQKILKLHNKGSELKTGRDDLEVAREKRDACKQKCEQHKGPTIDKFIKQCVDDQCRGCAEVRQEYQMSRQQQTKQMKQTPAYSPQLKEEAAQRKSPKGP